MIKLIRSMFYRATHDIFFYIAIGACIIFSLLIISFTGSELKNHVPSVYDENIKQEKTDTPPLNTQEKILHEFFGKLKNYVNYDIINIGLYVKSD